MLNVNLIKGAARVGLGCAVVGAASGLVCYVGFKAMDAIDNKIRNKRAKKGLQDPFGDIKELESLVSFCEKLEKDLKTKNERVTIGGMEFEKVRHSGRYSWGKE